MKYEWRFEDEERICGDIVTYGRPAIEAAAEAGLRPSALTDPFHRRVYELATINPDGPRLHGLDAEQKRLAGELVDPDRDVLPSSEGIAADITMRVTRLRLGGGTPRLTVSKLRPVSLEDCDKYGEVAIRRMGDAMRHADRGARNQTLNAIAWSSARLVRDGHATESAVRHLQDIALDSGLPPREVRTTWKSGWDAGWAA